MKKLILWLAKKFGVVTERVVIEKVTEVIYLGSEVDGDVTIHGDLLVKSDLKVTGCITIKKEV